jgi:hypothetical protein
LTAEVFLGKNFLILKECTMEILIITLAAILIISILLFKDEVGELLNKIAGSKTGFLYILLPIMIIVIVLITQAE